jgi:hypothetical protein
MTLPTEIRLIDIYTTVVRTETKVNSIEQQLPDHEVRLRGLERFRWTLMGIALASGGLSGWVTNLLLLKK